ncbi:MAG TPA: RES domain-containing protein [Vicinamibacterales bacterium]|nr:RES domain-containing protein [Vicinamibacterales bacterium]
MEAYRIGASAFPLLDGRGAAASETARWNSWGRSVIYTAEHYSTALLEKAAQLNGLEFPRTLVYARITIPPDVTMEEVRAEDLRGWDSDEKIASQGFGDRWYDERRTLILVVPSLATRGLERNVLINQDHAEFSRVTASAAEPLRCHPKLLL